MKIDDINDIGTRIKERRKKMSLTISEMALYTGLSVGYLSNIERNQTSPTLSNLKLICEALGIAISDLIQTDAEERTIIRKKDMLIREYPQYHQSVGIIDFKTSKELYEYITIQPGKPEAALESMHPYDEVCTVIQGTMVIIIDEERYVLNKGDSAYIKARSKHSILNESDKACVSFWNYKRS